MKKITKMAESFGAVHTHTHTRVILKDRKTTQKHCVYQDWNKRQIM